MKNIILTFSIILTTSFAFSQVKDISVTFSPAAEYTFWDDKSGLDDGLLYGGNIGFGFGEYIELRATYMQGLDLVTNFEDFGINGFTTDLIPERDVELTRWGGEFKANFSTKSKLNPYFTLGSGVQSLNLDGFDKNEQIYASLGLGAKFNISKRIVLSLEAKNTVFNFNSGARLLTNDDKTTLGVTNADFEAERLSNWSALASLEFYLSGRRPGELTELDKAYLKTFSSGFKGLRFTVEPSLAHLEFDSDSNLKDAWFLGGYAGLDFNDYIGVRAFYFKATNNDEISTDFDDLQMYGGEFRARLNVPRGVVPYIAIGGGYLDASNNYLGVDGLSVESSYFASGGVGLNIPLSKEVTAFGGVRAMITSDTAEENLQNPEEIMTHTMYNFGLKFNIGKRSKSAQSVYKSNVKDEVNTAILEQNKINKAKIEKLKAEYKAQINKLESDLQKATEEKDVDKAVQLIDKKNEVKKDLEKVENLEKTNEKLTAEKIKSNNSNSVKLDSLSANYDKRISKLEDELKKLSQSKDQKNTSDNDIKKSSEELINLTPVEFELLIDRILEKVQEPNYNESVEQSNNQQKESVEKNVLKERVEVLEKLLLQLNAKNLKQNTTSKYSSENEADANKGNTPKQNEVLSMEILNKLNELNSKISQNANKIDLIDTDNNTTPQTIIVNPSQSNNDKNSTVKTKTEEDQFEDRIEIDQSKTSDKESMLSKLSYKNTSAMFGVLLGEDTFPTTSLRMHYAIKDSKFEFMPELFLGVTDPLSFGFSLNGIRPIQIIEDSQIKPYVGAGLGYMKIFDDGKLNANLILGSYINVLDGKLYIDFTTRNFFNYNQLSVGYQFNF
ncbi:MAG: outer membrane beta-barrel protein [Bacteroidetes bacterium]|jgi:hypothetical protein|nr:outer membrane beta-barrel protein [Bacteroidota bacterium]